MADPHLAAEVPAIDGGAPVAKVERVALEGAREVRPGERAVLDRLADAFAGRDVDARGLADEQDPRPRDRGTGLEASLGELLESVA